MTLSEKSAYLKGLMDGLKLDTEKDEGKMIAAIVDMLSDVAETVSDLEDVVEQLVKEHLVMRERFVVHEYDTQTHPANYFYIPYYGIPIGIMRQWRSHIIRKADYVNYMNSLLAPMIETKNMGIYLQETSPMMAFSAPYIYGQKSFEDSIIRIQDGLKSSYEHGRASQNGQSKGVLGWLKSFKK